MTDQTKPPASESSGTPWKYWAFISYSHADEAQARWLHHRLETYRLPKSLIGRATGTGEPAPRRLFPVFRDRDELPGAPDLGAHIKRALAQSRTLIVICSARSAQSPWVNEEIRQYKALGRADRVLALIVSGEPNAVHDPDQNCFPAALRYLVDAEGRITDQPAEPIAADIRPGKDERHDALLKLVAGIVGVGLDDLKRRDLLRRRRQQFRLSVAAVLGLIACLWGYVGLADAGQPVVGGEWIRRQIDRRDLSYFRPAASREEILTTAAELRPPLVEQIVAESRSGQWIVDSPARRIAPRRAVSVWVASQAITAALMAPETTKKDAQVLLPNLEAAFAPGYAMESGGVKYGWPAGRYDHPQAEPALWTIAALSAALARPDLWDEPQRERFRRQLDDAQEAAEAFGPADDGGWNVLARQYDPGEHLTYSTVLALWALLEVRAADLPWRGDAARRDALIRQTAGWLVDTFDDRASPPGWRFDLDQRDENNILDGLTLLAYCVLLRAEAEAGLPLPAKLTDAVDRQVAALQYRTAGFANSRGSVLRLVHPLPLPGEPDDPQSPPVDVNINIGFGWYPYAVECAARWLTRLQHSGALPEECVAARRVLGYLLIDLRQDQAAAMDDQAAWLGAEMLIGLSSLPEVLNTEK